jgi:DNA replication protein DnaC
MAKSLDEQVKELQQRQGTTGARPGGMSSLGSMIRTEAKHLRPIVDEPEPVVASAFPPDSCEVCGGLGVIRYDVEYGHPAWGKLHPCPNPTCPKMLADRAHRMEVVMARGGVPARYKDMTFESFMALADEDRYGKELAAACMYKMATSRDANFMFSLFDVVAELYPGEANVYSRVEKNWVVLGGDYGLGKTGLAAAFSNIIAADGVTPEYHRLDDLFREIQSRYDGDPRDDPTAPQVSAKTVLDLMCDCQVLVLDDFNTHHVTPDRRTIVEALIRRRAADRRPTIITTNLTQDEFTAMWTERTAAIVRENAHWLVVTGNKLRRDDAPIVGW